jgi:hypothetical protein
MLSSTRRSRGGPSLCAADARNHGQFAGVHRAPESSSEVPDEMEARLVILGPEQAHEKGVEASPARMASEGLLTTRGSTPRIFRNMLVFLAPDAKKLKDIEEAVRSYMAWKSILDDEEALNLTAFAKRQAQAKRSEAEKAIEARIPEAWIWCLVPDQQDAASPTVWLESRLQGQGSLPERAARKLQFDEELLTVIGPARLKLELDRYLWKDKPHLGLKQLWQYIASYLYLPRLRDSQVLLDCVKEAITRGGMYCEHFAYAERWDEAAGRYDGLKAMGGGSVAITSDSVLVRPETAQEHAQRRTGEAAPELSGLRREPRSRRRGRARQPRRARLPRRLRADSTAASCSTPAASAATRAASPRRSSSTWILSRERRSA